MTRRILEYGRDALLVECADGAEARALQATLAGRSDPEIDELVPGARTVLITLADRPRSELVDFLAHGDWTRPNRPTPVR